MDPYREFVFQMPTKLVYGPGTSKRVGDELKALSVKKALVVTDPGILKAGLLDGIVEGLRRTGPDFAIYDQAETDPSFESVDRCLAAYRAAGCDGLLGVGGGSSMDTAKGAGVMATNSGTVTEVFRSGKVQNPLPPLVAIPTTCGTGSEVTMFAVFTDKEAIYKFGVASPYVMPRVGILDPLLLVNLPPRVVASTGMDALTHAIESYTNKNAQPISDGLDLHAIKLIGEHLRPATGSGSLDSIANMLIAATIAGIGFANTRVGIVHAMSQPVGARIGVPHGVANAIILPYVMEYNLIGAPQRFADIAAALGEDTRGMTTMDAARLSVDAVRRLSADVGIPATLGEVGLTEHYIEDLADDSMKSANVGINPRRTTHADFVALFRSVLG